MKLFIQKTTKLNERGWTLLLTEIQKGNVIPIVGDKFFTVNVAGEEIPLKKYIAMELAKSVGVDYEDGLDATQLASKFFEPYWDAIDSDPYYETTQILKRIESGELKISETLKKFLSIDKFSYTYLSLSFCITKVDSLLPFANSFLVMQFFMLWKKCGVMGR